MSTSVIKIPTTRFGELDVPESSVISVVGGVIGFPNLYKFVLLAYNPPFSWLQSVERPDLAFVVVNGGEFGDEYTFPLPVGDPELKLGDDDEVAIINLVSVRPDPSMTTVNLKAPIIVNMANMKARQVVLDNPRYPVRMPLWAPGDEPSEESGSGEGKK